MRVILLKPLFSIILTNVVIVGLCQTTASSLGDSLFRVFQTNSLSRLDKFVPSADQMIEIAKCFESGQSLIENDINEFRNRYPNEIEKFKEKYQEIINKGKALGVNWPTTQIKEIKIIPIPVNLSEEQKDTTIALKGVSVLFSSSAKSFLLTFQIAAELSDKWYIADNKIYLEAVKE